MHTIPFHIFKVEVAQRLQKPPFNWAGACGYEIARKYASLIDRSWQEFKEVDETAALVDGAYMNRPVDRVAFPTKSSMVAAGCKFYEV